MRIAKLKYDDSDGQTLTLVESPKESSIRKELKEATRNAFNNVARTWVVIDNKIMQYNDENCIGKIVVGHPSHSDYYMTIHDNLHRLESYKSSKGQALDSGFLDFISELKNKKHISTPQCELAYEAIRMLINSSFNEKLIFKFSIEDEILFIKNNSKGNHYLIFGDEENEVSYGFVGNEIGEYSSLHSNNKEVKLINIVEAFING